MKALTLALLLLLVGARAGAEAPDRLLATCVVEGHRINLRLTECGHKVAQVEIFHLDAQGRLTPTGRYRDTPTGGIGAYWCEGPLTDDLLVRKSGILGESDTEVRITYRPGRFSGRSPIEINGTKIDCR